MGLKLADYVSNLMDTKEVLKSLDKNKDIVTAIFELGRVYKEKNEEWVYGDIERFILDNLYDFLLYAYDVEVTGVHYEYDHAVDDWYKERFEKLHSVKG